MQKGGIAQSIGMVLAVLAGVAVAQTAPATDGPTTIPTASTEDQQVYEQAKALYAASRALVRTLDVEFDYDSFQKKHFHYVADGPKYYCGFEVYNADGRVNHASEESFDGEKVFVRMTSAISIMPADRRRDSELIPPDELAGMSAGEAIGVDKLSTGNMWYELQSARWRQDGAERLAELTFTVVIHPVKRPDLQHPTTHPTTMEFTGPPHPMGTLKTILSSKIGYLPVSTERETFTRVGKRFFGSATAEYVDHIIDGKHVFYPTSGTWLSTVSGETKTALTFHVTSLKLNEPVPNDRFVLEPWPNQEVADGVNHRSVRPQQPDWKPLQVGFPFQRWLDEIAGRPPAVEGVQ